MRRNVCSFSLMLTVLASSLFVHAAQQTGKVQSGVTPIAFSTVTLYSAGGSPSAAAAVLGKAKSDARGFFSISFTPPADSNAVLYLIADGGALPTAAPDSKLLPGAIRQATVLGPKAEPAGVVINERTTSATAYAMAQFINGVAIAGKAPGLQNAAATLRNLVDVTSGEAGFVLANPPNGLSTSTMREFNSLANLLAGCVRASAPAPCASLFGLATPPGGTPPQDTLQAAVNIAHFPWQNAVSLFDLSQAVAPYRPALPSAPDAWTLAISYNGNGHEFDGPGNMAIDKDGNVWSTNNYTYNSDPRQLACSGETLIKLTPTGIDAPGAPYSGGGINGAGFGISLDPDGDVWVGNFGFEGEDRDSSGPQCPKPPADSVSKFNPDGTPISGDNGYTQGPISFPQGTASDQQGNIWIANCGSASVTRFAKGNPDDSLQFGGIGLVDPFGTAIDGDGNLWVTGNGSDSVAALASDGSILPGSPFSGAGISAPLGVAADSLGNVWVANSGVIPLSAVCDADPKAKLPGKPSVTEISRGGKSMRKFTGGGLIVPWGIAVDGNDNIWVANFAGRRLTEFCGARPSKCPPGFKTGDPISPETGFGSDALTRNTGVAIDPSGNVWLANNWLELAVQTNPGGHELVVFIGLAAPIKTPLIGPPQQP